MCWHVNTIKRVSKKGHVCYGCEQPIEKKSKVEVVTSADGEKIWSIYFCENCVKYCKDNKCTTCRREGGYESGFVAECKKVRGA